MEGLQVNHLFNPHLGNIFSVYAKADKIDKEFGKSAYENYHEQIAKIAVRRGCFVHVAIGMFAALSPNIDEKSNFTALIRLLEGASTCPGYPMNIEKAKRIMAGAEPLGEIQGLKTKAFYLNILCPVADNAVVVDAHIFSVWNMKRVKVQEVEGLGRNLYDQISEDFRTVAKILGMRANQLQATCWSTWKRVHNISLHLSYDSQLVMFKEG